MKNTIKEYLLNNMEVTKEVVHYLNSWNSCLDYLEVCNMEDLDECLEGYEPSEIINMIFYGDGTFSPNCDYFRFNGYGNLESLDEYDLEVEYKLYLDEIVEALLDNMDNIDIFDDELQDMLDKIREEKEEEKYSKIKTKIYLTLDK